jgi:predicted TIM-barrel fold metal-dependent hydrolase
LASDEAVDRFAARPKPKRLAADPKFREGVGELQRMGLVFDAFLYHSQLGDVVELARSFPDLPIVVNHLGGILGVESYHMRREEVRAEWLVSIRALALCPNVKVKLGGLGMIMVGFDFHKGEIPPSSESLAAGWRQFIDPCIEAFGVDRCMFESNFPPDKQTCGYSELWNAFKRIAAGCSTAEKYALFAGTAACTYGMDLHASS